MAQVEKLARACGLSPQDRRAIARNATGLVKGIRRHDRPGLMEAFLAEYGLSSREGVALMCLAEALLRVPDAPTIDALIQDKIAPSDWRRHLGHSTSMLVNASTWGLMLTGRVLANEPEGLVGTLRALVRRLGEPVIRTAVGAAMAEMGNQFVLGEDIGAAMERATVNEQAGYTHSYDMLGEAAVTKADARKYLTAYHRAIAAIGEQCMARDITQNPGISVKLSALHPRYEETNRAQVMEELPPRLLGLARAARDANMGLNVDAEESERLALSLDVMEAVLADPSLKGWAGFGIVVQAYNRSAMDVLERIGTWQRTLDRALMVRLVKGAYWDREIKRAQVLGLSRFPVFTTKQGTDISYLAAARRLLDMGNGIYPQFATHNAHTVAAILRMAEPGQAFEFQRLHGMGENLHELVRAAHGTR
ncbi:MAG TPA: bifunctional proline dehydrogenase/L-glutamate gamma-semialdehyde dehydrogenase, partial [Devosia sp.]|nr:bifunctional proline dehydrogenase/L-glutamate gamma-semialdehyde dehydrogenase [Devosia sp.]